MNFNDKTIDRNQNLEMNNKEGYFRKRKQEKEEQKRNNIPKFLMYAAATLSFISFLTTADGMVAVIGQGERWKAHFISFGIQAIVLVLGTKFLNIWEILSKLKSNSTIIIRILMTVLYICSIIFSSFFSFVFMANHAYNDVKPSDYNIAVEQFLVSETKNLRDINDATGRVLLAEIQGNAYNFRSLLSDFQATASSDLQEIISTAKLTKNSTSTISDALLFNAQSIIDRYEISNDSEIETLRNYETRFKEIADGYEQSYRSYNTLFDELQSLSDPSLAEQRIDRIDSEIQSINNYISSLDGINDTSPRFNTALQQAKSSIKNEFDKLSKSYRDIKDVYNEIKGKDLEAVANIDLQKVYTTIYSPVDILEDDINEAISTLQDIIKKYIETLDTVEENDEVIRSLSVCITYLGEFKKYKDLDTELSNFESKTLNKVYIINHESTFKPSEEPTESTSKLPEESTKSITTSVPNTTLPESSSKISDETTNSISPASSNDSSTESTSNEMLKEVNFDKWRQERRTDIAEFIRLLKKLPNVKLLVQTMENSGLDSTAELKELQSYNDYVDTTLSKAYQLNRDKIENINEVERAWRFLKSEYKFMAIFCALIAFFMDFASFLIGIFLYFNEKDNHDNDKKESAKIESATQQN